MSRVTQFGESERLTPDEARQFLQDLTKTMRERAWKYKRHLEEQGIDHDFEQSEDGPSLQKQMYGDSWVFIYGIVNGMQHMKAGSEYHMSYEDDDEWWEIDDADWQEHYDEYGYGVYGDGLEIGKKLAFYKDSSFTFSSGTDVESESASKTEDDESGFTFTDYSDE